MAELANCPPWLIPYWQKLQERRVNNTLPHALLISGQSGIGKAQFAQFVAQSLLCRTPSIDGAACGSCSSCAQLIAESHAEYRCLQPEGASRFIKVDSVRSLTEWLQLTAGGKSHRLALITAADRMNRAASNSLLKTLEEPGDAAILILVSDKPATLPATIRSRCQSLVLHQTDNDSAIEWLSDKVADPAASLQEARGAPLRAVELADSEWQAVEGLLTKAWLDLFLHRASVGRIVDSLKDVPVSRALRTFAAFTVAANRQLAGSPVDSKAGRTAGEVVQCLESVQWFTIYESLLKLTRLDSASFKSQTVLEGLFADIRLKVNA